MTDKITVAAKALVDAVDIWIDLEDEAIADEVFSDLERALAELRALTDQPEAPAQGQWQPIETAPKDTPILVCCEYEVNGKTFGEIWVDVLWQGEWLWWPKIITAPFKPNHWMPRPAPPAPDGAQVIVERIDE